MKRVLFSIIGTVLGLVALLSFKSHGSAVGSANGLPSAALPAGGTSTSAPRSPASSSAPPAGPSSSAPATARTASRTVMGDAIQTPYGVVQVKVTLSGSRITNVGFAQLSANDGTSQQINSAAAPILLQQTLSAQRANIDGVSGASYTSHGYEQSLQSALDKAGVH
ncbi:MAG: FMN-binding protein [Jatrophihabitantaceae bacterium]